VTTVSAPVAAQAEQQALGRRGGGGSGGGKRHSGSIGPKGFRRWLPYLGIALIVIYCLAPFYWMVVSSFRRTSDIFSNAPVPTPVSVESYQAVFDPENHFLRALLNSVIVAGITTISVLVVAIFAAYALARLNFRGKNITLAVIIATSMFPGISLLVPLLKLFTSISWINTYQAMIVPSMSFALPLAVWNLTAFFRQMPFELEEAAQIDGCSPGQAFRKVILPLAAPGVFTTAIITFIAAWNEYIIALSVVTKQDYKTATVAISQFSGAFKFDSPFGSQMAAGVVVTVPLLIMVLLFQRRIVAGLTAGGVK
jgi:multiple sugar transport system permease protein